MPFLKRLLGNAHGRQSETEWSDGAVAESDETEELSEEDLEEVFGGLERIHSPGEIESPEEVDISPAAGRN